MEAQGMIERVARALCLEVGNISYDDLPESATYLERKTHVDRPMLDRQEAREVAKVAIKAMRTPSQAMMDAGDGCCGEYGCGDYRMKQIFSAMIDAALNDQERT